jgi:hypothetical protein
MIGPHEGKELELMLAGEKEFALFFDIVKPSYQIPESVIPEQSFAPHVKANTIVRITRDLVTKDKKAIRYVCFTLPDNEWRAYTFLWAKQEILSGNRPADDAYEYLVGRLLGYEEVDIKDFLDNKKSFTC